MNFDIAPVRSRTQAVASIGLFILVVGCGGGTTGIFSNGGDGGTLSAAGSGATSAAAASGGAYNSGGSASSGGSNTESGGALGGSSASNIAGSGALGGGASNIAGSGALGGSANGGSTSDAGSAGNHGTRSQVASIKVTASTNSSEINVVVFDDGSADRTVGPPKPNGRTNPDPMPKAFPAGSPEGLALLADLQTIGNLAALTSEQCAKSVSFGTVATLSANGEMSGDLECLANPTPADTALVSDCSALVGVTL